MTTGRKRGLILSLILHIFILLWLLYAAKNYYEDDAYGGPKKNAPASVSMIAPPQQSSSDSTTDTAAHTSEPDTPQPVNTPKIDTPPTEIPATTLISTPPESKSDQTPTQRPKRKRRLSSSGWYQQPTAHPSSCNSSSTPQSSYKEHPLLSTVTTAMQRQQRQPVVQEDAGELQTFALEFEAYQRKMLSSFRRAAASFERHYISDRNTNTIVRGTLVIGDDGALEEVRFANSSGDRQIDYFLKEFFMSAKMPPLPPRLKGKPFLHPFSVECHMGVGTGTMRIFISS